MKPLKKLELFMKTTPCPTICPTMMTRIIMKHIEVVIDYLGASLQDLYNKHCIPKSRYPLDIDTLKEAARDSFEGIFDTFFERFYE